MPPTGSERLHHTRLASMLAFMLIEFTRRDAVAKVSAATHGEFGWILEDNKGMLSIAELPGAAGEPPLQDFRYRRFSFQRPLSCECSRKFAATTSIADLPHRLAVPRCPKLPKLAPTRARAHEEGCALAGGLPRVKHV